MSSKPVPIVPAMASDISRNLAEPDIKRHIARCAVKSGWWLVILFF
jgi:hypothetical protein